MHRFYISHASHAKSKKFSQKATQNRQWNWFLPFEFRASFNMWSRKNVFYHRWMFKQFSQIILNVFRSFFFNSFNLPRVAAQLEKLMGSRWEFKRFSLSWTIELIGFIKRFSVVRLTDRKYMLDLQKRIHEDYHDTLMKRISQRQVSVTNKWRHYTRT